MTAGDPGSRRRLETRFLVRTEAAIYGATYRWNAEESEAYLVPEGIRRCNSIVFLWYGNYRYGTSFPSTIRRCPAQ